MSEHDAGLIAIVGLLLPMVVAAVIQPEWSDAIRSIVTFLICIVATVVTSLLGGDLGAPGFEWVTWFGGIYTVAMASYRGLYKPTGIAGAIEAATSPRAAGGVTDGA